MDNCEIVLFFSITSTIAFCQSPFAAEDDSLSVLCLP